MALPEDHHDYIPKDRLAEAIQKFLLPTYLKKVREKESGVIGKRTDAKETA